MYINHENQKKVRFNNLKQCFNTESLEDRFISISNSFQILIWRKLVKSTNKSGSRIGDLYFWFTYSSQNFEGIFSSLSSVITVLFSKQSTPIISYIKMQLHKHVYTHLDFLIHIPFSQVYLFHYELTTLKCILCKCTHV